MSAEAPKRRMTPPRKHVPPPDLLAILRMLAERVELIEAQLSKIGHTCPIARKAIGE
jgi:hypothetical protein